jgi:hypothetical protein
MTISTKFNCKFATLPKYSSMKTNNYHSIYSTRSTKKRIFEERRILQIKHQPTLRKSLKGKLQISENIKSSLTTHQHHKCQNVFIKRRSNITTMFFKQSSNNNMTRQSCQRLKSDNNDRSNVH